MKILDILREFDNSYYDNSIWEGQELRNEINNWFEKWKNESFTDEFGNKFIISGIMTNVVGRIDDEDKSELEIKFYVNYNFYDDKVPKTLYTAPSQIFINKFKEWVNSNNIDISKYKVKVETSASRIRFTFKDLSTRGTAETIISFLPPFDQIEATVTNIDRPEGELMNYNIERPVRISYNGFESSDKIKKRSNIIFKTHSKGTVSIYNTKEEKFNVEYELVNPQFYYSSNTYQSIGDGTGYVITVGKITTTIMCDLVFDLQKLSSTVRHLPSPSSISDSVIFKIQKIFENFDVKVAISKRKYNSI
jgi:hypothetical protein